MPGLKLVAELGLDGAAFAAGLKQARGLAQGFGGGIKNALIGAIGIGTVAEVMRRTVETAKELVTTSQRLAIAPEQLQVMRQAAQNANVEFSDLVSTMEKLSVAREKALIPGKEGQGARRAFAALGVSNEQLHSMTNAQLLLGPIRNAVTKRNPEEIGIIFRELGLRAFGGLMPVLKTNFEELEAKMKRTGAIMDTDTVVKLKHLSDEFNLLGKIITSQAGPALVAFAESAYKYALQLGKNLSSVSAFYGAGTSGKGFFGGAVALLKSAGLGAEHLFGMIDDKELKSRLANTLNLPAAQSASGDAMKPWEDRERQLNEFLREMKAEADKLNHPEAPHLETSAISPKLSRKELSEQSDSLVKIGNFLGGSDRTIARLQEKQVYWLEKIHGKIVKNSGYKSELEFPMHNVVGNIMMGPNFPHN